MLAAGVVLLMAATLAADVVLSNSAIIAVGPPTSSSGEVLRAEMTGYYPSGAAIRGFASSTGTAVSGSSSSGIGVFGASSSASGVYGSSQNGHGGHFRSNGGFGVYAYATGTYYWDHGVYASAHEGYGVYGKSSRSIGVYGEGSSYGVRGRGGYRGVYGASAGEAGVYGYHDAYGDGVKGRSNSGTGVYGEGPGSSGVGVRGYSSGTNGYGGHFTSTNYRGIYARSYNPSWYAGLFDGGAGVGIFGDLYVSGTKSGYVVDLARNNGSDPLQVGDVVLITGATDPVLGEIPVPTVRLADESASAGVMGVVDRMFATPEDAATIPEGMFEAWYELISMNSAGAGAESVAAGYDDQLSDNKTTEMPLRPSMESPGRFVSRAEAEFLAVARGADPGIAPGAYLGVVTLGAFKAIRVDASYGSILPGDLLVSSPTPGHAMRAADPAPGTIIGKALGSLEEGQGSIPVLITLH
jgi:hypothetical protein